MDGRKKSNNISHESPNGTRINYSVSAITECPRIRQRFNVFAVCRILPDFVRFIHFWPELKKSLTKMARRVSVTRIPSERTARF